MIDLSDLYQSYSDQLSFIIPELIIGIGILLIIVIDLLGSERFVIITGVSVIVIIFTSILSLSLFPTSSEAIFYNSLFPNRHTLFFRLLADVSMLLIFIFRLGSNSEETDKKHSEYPAIWLSILFAVHFLILSNHWLMVFLSIEMISICSYILIGMGLSKNNIESSFKYLVFGALSSGIMLFGISLILVKTSNLYFSGFEFSYSGVFEQADLLSLGLIMAFSGIFFKLSLFPFHFWVPDVYQGTSLPVMAMLSVIPKIAAFGFFSCQILLIWPSEDFQLGNISLLIAALALLSVVWGNLSALGQKDFARLFAYSGIAQGGFIMISILNGIEGLINLEFYLSLYVCMNLVVFISADMIQKNSPQLSISDFSGLGRKNILLPLIIVFAMISLIGLPPSGGFTAKYIVLTGVFEWYAASGEPIRLIIFFLFVINVVISLFYYLKLPYTMYFGEPTGNLKKTKTFNYSFLFIASFILILSFFFYDTFKEFLKHLGADII